MRVVTNEAKEKSRSTVVRRAASKRGLVVKSAEGVRFAHTSTPLPVKTADKATAADAKAR